MIDPWTVLNLDPRTATEKDVRAAYAGLLKQFRPERDPEGFQRLRQAYEAALALFSRQEKPATPAWSPDTAQGPGPWREALQQLEDAATAGTRPRFADALENLYKVGGLYSMTPLNMERAVARVLAAHLTWPADDVSEPELLEYWRAGRLPLARVVFTGWEDRLLTPRMLAFAEAVARNAPPPASTEAAVFVYELGLWAAYWSPDLASALANAAFPLLDKDRRESLMAELEARLVLGRQLRILSEPTREFWWIHLRSPGRVWDWTTPESEKALTEFAERIDDLCHLLDLLQRKIPEAAMARLQTLIQAGRERSMTDFPLVERGSFFLRGVPHAILGVIILLGVIGFLSWICTALAEWWRRGP
jgi:hypothetical protein